MGQVPVYNIQEKYGIDLTKCPRSRNKQCQIAHFFRAFEIDKRVSTQFDYY